MDIYPDLYDPIIFSTYEPPKTYSYIPESFKLHNEDPDKFLPDRMLKQFNEKMFYNFLHRECFNVSVTDSSSLTDTEQKTYSNCLTKHLNSIGIFRDVVLAKKKWRGFQNYISIKEYSRSPEEMTTNIPTDPALRAAYYNYERHLKGMEAKNAFIDLFGVSKRKQTDIFQMYLNGVYAPGSKMEADDLAAERKDKYNEYKELNAKYGDRIQALLKRRVNPKDWKEIAGENFVPDDEEGNQAQTDETEPSGNETGSAEDTES